MAERGTRNHLLNPGVLFAGSVITLKDAIVLVPVIDKGKDVRMIFMQSISSLRKHSGQIAFSGGGIINHEDRMLEAAILRESEEKIGLYIEALGLFRNYISEAGFSYSAGVSVVRPGF